MGKICPSCGIWKQLDGYHLNSQRNDGRQSWCKTCNKASNDQRYFEPDPSIVEMACNACAEVKPVSDFSPSTNIRGGYRLTCKECRRDARRAVQYTLPADWYQNTLEEQGGVCDICQTSEQLVVDHDHSCCPGKASCGLCIRGLLCQDCNIAIGLLRDDAGRLLRAIDYVEKHQPWEGGG